MAAFIGYESALALLRNHASLGGGELPTARITRLPSTALEVGASVSGCPVEAFVAGKVHLMVPDHKARSEKPGCVCHIWSGLIVPGSFHALGDGIFVSTPEFLFLQMAGRLAFPQVVQLGMELCGTYVINRGFGRGIVTSTTPLTSVAKLERFLGKASGRYGAKNARLALKWILDGSNSPMESSLGMLMHLPRTRGGQNLSGFVFNRTFPLSAEWRRRLGAASFKPDLFFTEKRVALEYHGKADHSSEHAKSYDATRQTLMEYLGIRVIGVTKEQLYHPDKYIGLLKELYKLLDKPFRRPTPSQQISTLQLKDVVLPHHNSSRYIGTFWH